MKLDRAAVVTTYSLAAGVCLSGTLLTGILSSVPLPVADRTVTVSLFVCLPLALAVIVRAGLTRAPADAVLAAFAVPCLLATTWTLSGVLRTSAGVSLGALVSLGAGLLLSIVLLVDGVITRIAVPERT